MPPNYLNGIAQDLTEREARRAQELVELARQIDLNQERLRQRITYESWASGSAAHQTSSSRSGLTNSNAGSSSYGQSPWGGFVQQNTQSEYELFKLITHSLQLHSVSSGNIPTYAYKIFDRIKSHPDALRGYLNVSDAVNSLVREFLFTRQPKKKVDPMSLLPKDKLCKHKWKENPKNYSCYICYKVHKK